MNARRLTTFPAILAATLALSVISLAGCTSTLPPEEQFSRVAQRYPAVAEHLAEADLVLDFMSKVELLDLIDVVSLNDPEVEAILREGARISQCGRLGRSCGRLVCVTRDADCGNCEGPACVVRETLCRASARHCHFSPVP